MGFKKDFVWGAATAAYQIEGAYNEDGRGLSIWDVFSHQPGKIFDNHNGDSACDHYHRFRDDIKLMKEIGIKAYRFSISWTRIIPDGTGAINEKGVKFYSELIDELIANGIEPYITLFHWDYPYTLHKKGGWLNNDSVDWFKDYAALVVELFSDRVTHYITFNEPQCFIGSGYLYGEHAPGLKCTYNDLFQMAHNIMKAHGAAVIAMRKAAKQPIKIGYSPTGTTTYPSSTSEADIEAARKQMFDCPQIEHCMSGISWWSDPIVLGHYPEDGLKKYAPYLPEITDEDMQLIHQPIDFYCQNIYQGIEVCADENNKPTVVPRKTGFPQNAMGWAITPECLHWGPKFLYDRYKLPFYISENGMASSDLVSEDGCVHDAPRIEYIKSHLKEFEHAADEGTDCCGYFCWSLMDNFEWAYGYSARFGLIYIDYVTQERIIKDSGRWYGQYIADFTKQNL